MIFKTLIVIVHSPDAVDLPMVISICKCKYTNVDIILLSVKTTLY